MPFTTWQELSSATLHTCFLQLGRNCHLPHCTHVFYNLAGTVICHTTQAFALLGRNCHLPCYTHIHSIEAVTVISDNTHAFTFVDRSCTHMPVTTWQELSSATLHTCVLQLGRNCHLPHCIHAFYHLAGTVICHTTHAFALLGRNCHLPCYIHIHSIEAVTVISDNKHAFTLVDRSCRLPPYTRICT